MMHTERHIQNMRTSRRYISSCGVRFICTMATKPLTTVSRLGHSTRWIRYVFLKMSLKADTSNVVGHFGLGKTMANL